MKINIIDTSFSHAPSSSWYNKPINFDWTRNGDGGNKLTFVTDSKLHEYNSNNYIAWIIEPRSIVPDLYGYVKHNNHFNKVLTFDKELLELLPNALFYPYGSCWIPEQNRNLTHQKSKLLSIIVSSKRETEGHKLRHEVVNRFQGKFDLFGSGYRPIQDKGDALYPYYYSIIIENGQFDNYFTEKIIDCFKTGVIPIYCGANNISKFFNDKGIIKFNNISELENILLNLDVEYYKNNQQAINENFILSNYYLIAEDWIYNNYKYLFE